MTANPKDLIGLTKPALRLVPPALALHVAGPMADGARKYGAYNWRENPVRMTVYLEAAMRHIYSLLDGEDNARDSGCHHAAHAAACMAIILDALETGNLVDDRSDGGPAADIIERMTSAKSEAKKYTSGSCTITLDGKTFDSMFSAIGFSMAEPETPSVAIRPEDFEDREEGMRQLERLKRMRDDVAELDAAALDVPIPYWPTAEGPPQDDDGTPVLDAEPDPFPDDEPTFSMVTFKPSGE